MQNDKEKFKSANESKLWLAILRDSKRAKSDDVSWFLAELDEISNIFASSILTLKGKKWFSLMILVNNHGKIEHIEGIWPICYRTNYQFLQKGPICPNKNAIKTGTSGNQLPCLFPSLPAPTVTVQTLTNSIQTIFPSPNGGAKTKPSDGYTVKPAAVASASDKAHLCNIRSCRKLMLYVLLNVSATAALLRGRLKYPRLKPPPDFQAGVVEKLRDNKGNLLKVSSRALFGKKKDIVKRIQDLGIGQKR